MNAATIPAEHARPGLFIAFEGGEGSGKSTQIELLAAALRKHGANVRTTFEPGATSVGQHIRKLVLHTDEQIAPRAEALLFAADRAHHVATVIRPALEAGLVVLTDRFVDSSVAYQGAGRDLTIDEVRELSNWATHDLVPDLTVLLDLPAASGLARAGGRSDADRLERESLAFHERVRTAFLQAAADAPERYLVLDATQPIEELAVQVHQSVETLIANRAKAGAAR